MVGEVRDLVELASLAEEARRNPRVLQILRLIGRKADELHVLALLTRLSKSKLFRQITSGRG